MSVRVEMFDVAQAIISHEMVARMSRSALAVCHDYLFLLESLSP